MRRALAPAILVLLLIQTGAATPARPAPARRAFVSIEGAAAVAVVNVASRRVIRRVAVAGHPHNVDATADGRVVVVTSPRAGVLTVIDGLGGRVLHAIRGLHSPQDAKLTADGRYAYVTEEGATTVAVVDTARGRIVGRVPVGAHPYELAVGDVVWVTLDGSSRVAVLGCPGSCQTKPGRTRLWARPRVGGTARDVVGIADSADAWFTYRGSSMIGGLTAGTRVRLRRSVIPSARYLAPDPYSGRRLWVSASTGEGAIVGIPAGRVLRRFDLRRPLNHLAVGGPNLVGVIANSPGSLVLLSRRTARRLGEIPLGTTAHDVAFAVVR